MADVTTHKKAYIAYIYRVIQEYSDEENPLTQERIIELVERDFGVTMERKVIRGSIQAIDEAGFPIKYTTTSRGNSEIISNIYYDAGEFTDGELDLLIDSVVFSKHIKATYADELIDKLRNLGSPSFRRRRGHVISSDRSYHAPNSDLFFTIEELSYAIAEKKKVCFDYNTIGVDGKLVKKYEQEIASPYYLVTSHAHYYLIASNNEGERRHYRVDKITDVAVLDEPAIPIEKGFNVQEYMDSHIFMFTGKPQQIVINIDNDQISNLVDSFGTNFNVIDQQEDVTKVSLKSNLDDFYYWSLQYGNSVEVISPQELRDKLRQTLARMANKYSITNVDRFNAALEDERTLDVCGLDLNNLEEKVKGEKYTRVRLGNNNVNDYSFINNLNNARIVSIEYDGEDLTNINLPNLFSFTLTHWTYLEDSDSCVIDNLDFLKNSTKLFTLNLREVDVNDISVIYELPNLCRITMSKATAEKLDLSKFGEEPIELEEHSREMVLRIPSRAIKKDKDLNIRNYLSLS